jgi:hypothetical protein
VRESMWARAVENLPVLFLGALAGLEGWGALELLRALGILQEVPWAAAWALGALAAATGGILVMFEAAAVMIAVRKWRESSQAARERIEQGSAALALVVFGDVTQTIFDAITSFLSTVANGVTSFFGTIFQSLANLFASVINAPSAAIATSFLQLTNWTSQFGPFAPIITILVTAVVVVIIVFLIWFVIRLTVSEGEQTGGSIFGGA